MSRGIVRALLGLPCKRFHHTWVKPWQVNAPRFFVCADCGEPGFRV